MNSASCIIFIHGAWQSSRCWHRMMLRLSAAGYTVHAPDLPGHGKQMKPAKSVTFDDYTHSIIELVKKQPSAVTLVGHSMAGMIISQVAEVIPEQIKQLVYVAAYVPQHGESLLTIAETSTSRGLSPYVKIDQANGEIRLQPIESAASVLYSHCDETDYNDAILHYQHQPLQPFTAKVNLGTHFDRINKRAVLCRHDKVLQYTDQQRMCQFIDDQVTLEADHSPFYSATQPLFDAITGEALTYVKKAFT